MSLEAAVLVQSEMTARERRDAIQVLRRAARLLRDAGMCQGAEARDERGFPVVPTSPRARAFSISGAIYAADDFDGSPESRLRLENALRLVPVANLRAWEDAPGRTVDEAVTVLDHAAATRFGTQPSGPPEPPAEIA